MTELVVLFMGFVAAILAGEVALGKKRSQSALGRFVAVQILFGVPILLYLVLCRGACVMAVTVFWGGAALSWFGVRSHIESSILLRMVIMLRGGPMDRSELLARYQMQYGLEERIEELIRSGLVERSGTEYSVTRKGLVILRVHRLLRTLWRLK